MAGLSKTDGSIITGLISLGANFIPAYKVADELGETSYRLVVSKAAALSIKSAENTSSLIGAFTTTSQVSIAKYDDWMFRFLNFAGISTINTNQKYLEDLEMMMHKLINDNKGYFESLNCGKSQFDIAYNIAMAIRKGATLDGAINQVVNDWLLSYSANPARHYINVPSRVELEKIARDAYSKLLTIPSALADIEIITVSINK